jgi:uncharacterized membrane protein
VLQLFLILHIIGAIIAFGSTTVFSIIGAMAAREPMHANFGARLSERIETRIVVPFALTMPITGAFLIYYSQLDLTAPGSRWLLTSIVLYVIAILYAILVQTPAAIRMVDLTAAAGAAAAAARANAAPAAPAAPAGSAPAAPAAPAGSAPAAPAGPPPELRATARRLAMGGMLMTVLVVLVVILMVSKPGF